VNGPARRGGRPKATHSAARPPNDRGAGASSAPSARSGAQRDAAGGARVLIVDDHRLFADALRGALERRGLDVVGLAATGEEALRLAGELRPDVVLLDLGLPDSTGLDIGKEILARLPHTKIIAVSALESAGTVPEVIAAGFHGYFTKDIPMPDLMATIGAVLAGKVVVGKQLARARSGALDPEERRAAEVAHYLTPREREVLAALVEGLNGPQIAQRLSVTPSTARKYIDSVLTKLQVHSRLEATAYAVRYGIVDLRTGEL
jgi:DNA-binding NarL/FixJ family response regulator